MKTIAQTVLLGVVLAGCAGGEAGAPSAAASLIAAPNPAHRALAGGALAHVRSLVAKHGGPRLGFQSAAEVERATIGEPIPVYFTTGERLLRRTPGADPMAALGAPEQVLCPILVDGAARAAVVLGRDATGEWVVTSVGRSELVRRIERTAGARGRVALVTMHDLGVDLLASGDGGALGLRVLDERRSAGLPSGEPVPAEAAFAQLADTARLRGAALAR